MAGAYWGDLPPPNIVRQDSVRRGSDVGLNVQGLSIDPNADRTSFQSIPQSARQNRASTQTEAPTMSTQSPFASPIANSFRGDGLAPRPPSFPYGADMILNKDREFEDRRKRRESRNRDFYDESAPLPPEAPDPPRGLPMNYKLPFGLAGSAVDYQDGSGPSKPTRASDAGLISPTTTNPPEDFYRRSTEAQSRRDSLAESLQRRMSNGKPLTRSNTVDSKHERHDSHTTFDSESRKGSLMSETDRRKDWAPDKSPLQRLERRLTSITKEEKRARMEEAERRLREEKAARGEGPAAQTTARSQNQPVAKGQENIAITTVRDIPESASVQKQSYMPNEQFQRSGSIDKRRSIPVENQPFTESSFNDPPGVQEVAPVPKQEKSSLPQRSVSFRDRVSPDTIAAVPAGLAAGGLARSGSNKLRKDPPADYWVNRGLSTRFPGNGQQSIPPPSSLHPINRSQTDSELKPAINVNAPAVRRPSIRMVEQSPPTSSQQSADVAPSQQWTNLSKVSRVAEISRQLSQRHAERANAPAIPPVPTQHPVPQDENRAPVPIPGPPHPGEPQNHHHHHPLADLLHQGRDHVSNDGVYMAGKRLDEWKTGGVALLVGKLLDLEPEVESEPSAEKYAPWWESPPRNRQRQDSISSIPARKAEAYEGEYDGPTRFKPPLFLRCGPLLRYCGIRRERHRNRTTNQDIERDVWRGSIMIVTDDKISSYELAPTLRLFLQPMELSPPPSGQVPGDDGYVDPLAGLTKLGRDGRTLYIRPVEELEEEKDISREESDDGLFEMRRSGAPKPSSAAGSNGSGSGGPRQIPYDGEKANKYTEVRGFRLHQERGKTFWRFNIKVELRDKQQRIAYRINRGPAYAFWVPARDQAMNIMFHSCNGFSLSVEPDLFTGPDPLWRDVLNSHQSQPFHVMIGGGDQIYNDAVMNHTTIFREWLSIKNPLHKEKAPLTPEMQDELESFYLERYCMWFSQGLFSVANAQIPMINIYDDHDIIDGFGSYPDHYMSCPVMSGVGAIAFKYYMLFQHQSSIDEGEENEPSWLLGMRPGPYIPELSRSIFTSLGQGVAFLGLDCRTERMNDEVVSAETYHKVFDKLEAELVKGEHKHLIVLLGVPIAYPRMVWLENLLSSRLFGPVKAMGRVGLLGKGFLNRFDGGVEILDDIDDHWTARHHKEERNWLIQELQDLAAEKSIRVTILGGDVHLAAIGQFYSNPKLNIPKHEDFRYMPNIISSAIVNTPPPDMLADVLNKRNKVHKLDHNTLEDMIPIFTHDVNGKPRNNKRLLNRRNWCSIRPYDPELTPPSTPPTASNEPSAPRRGLLRRLSTSSRRSSSQGPYQEGSPIFSPPKRGLLRRFSTSRAPTYRTEAPPLSNSAFFGRRTSFSGGPRASMDSTRSAPLTRTLSLSRKDFLPKSLFRKKKSDSGGINGYGSDTDEDDEYMGQQENPQLGLRGGGGEEDGYFLARAQTQGNAPPPFPARVGSFGAPSRTAVTDSTPTIGPASTTGAGAAFSRSQFHRTPTGLTEKEIRQGRGHEVNLENGLDIRLHVEVSQKDPAGITAPYRLLVPALWYEDPPYQGEQSSDQSHDEPN